MWFNLFGSGRSTLGRPTGLGLSAGYIVAYAYDTLGRLASVTASIGAVAFSTAYPRLPSSGLLEATSFTIQNSAFDVRRSYAPHRDLLSAVANLWTHHRSPPSPTPTKPLPGGRCGSMMGP